MRVLQHANLSTTIRWRPWKGAQRKDGVSLTGARWERDGGRVGREVRVCGHICYWGLGLLKAQPNKQRTAEQRERGCQIWSPRIGSVSVLAQIKRECRENWASTRAGTPTGYHSEWGDCTTHPAALTHNTAVHLLIHLSGSSIVCVCVRACLYVCRRVCGFACVCVCVCCWEWMLIPWERCLYRDR